MTSKKPEDEARYDLLLDLYLDAKKIKALAPFTMSVFLQRAYAIGASYEHLEFQTHLLNAIPDLFTFLAYQGMSPHSNDVKHEIRDGIIPQRNVRHKTMTKKAVFRCQISSHSREHATGRKSRLAGRS